jgi:hypothetical protein
MSAPQINVSRTSVGPGREIKSSGLEYITPGYIKFAWYAGCGVTACVMVLQVLFALMIFGTGLLVAARDGSGQSAIFSVVMGFSSVAVGFAVDILILFCFRLALEAVDVVFDAARSLRKIAKNTSA